MQVKKQQLELDMEQQTGLKLGKKYCFKAVITAAGNLVVTAVIWIRICV